MGTSTFSTMAHATHREFGSMGGDSPSGPSGPRNRSKNPDAIASHSEPGGQAALRDIKTLVVEDDPVDQQIILQAATELGLRATLAADGEAAIAHLQAADKSDFFDLILIDFKLPNLDGLTASRYIKQELGLTHAPRIVLLSAYQRADIFRNAGDNAGVDGYLTKPINAQQLHELIQDLMETAKLAKSQWPQRNCNSELRLAHSHVLLVEDNAINQRVAIAILHRKQIKVSVAHNGQQAIDMITRAPAGTYDMVLMDLDMPIVDGYQATAAIRNDSRFQQLPIIALTAQNTQRIKDQCLAAGMSGFLTKPVKPNFLYQTMLDHLS